MGFFLRGMVCLIYVICGESSSGVKLQQNKNKYKYNGRREHTSLRDNNNNIKNTKTKPHEGPPIQWYRTDNYK
jgi:hypothetical protein